METRSKTKSRLEKAELTEKPSTNTSTLFGGAFKYLTSPAYINHASKYEYFVAGATILGYLTDSRASLIEYGTDVAVHLLNGLVMSGHLAQIAQYVELPYDQRLAFLATIPGNIFRLTDIYTRADYSTIPTFLNYADIVNHANSFLAAMSGTAQAQVQAETQEVVSYRR